VNRSRVVLLGVMGLGLVAAGCKSAPPPEPLSSLNPQQTHGHAVFEERCALCHYDRESGSLHGPSLLGVYKKPSLPSGTPANDDRVTDVILHGRGLMPAMGNTMDPQELNDLLAYLHTL
jgi:mono/diheme cytochrome c family protein